MSVSAEVPIALVVAASENDVIGRDGGLPWRMSSDLRWFKEVTLGKPVVMGRTTYESIGRPLPGRENVVLTRRDGFAPDGVHVAASWDEAKAAAQRLAREQDASEVCVIGGAQVYAAALPEAEIIYLTRVEARVEGDTQLALDPHGWRVEPIRALAPGPKDDHPARIEKWTRQSAG